MSAGMFNNKHIFPKLRYQAETRLFKLGNSSYFILLSVDDFHICKSHFHQIKKKKKEIIYSIYKKNKDHYVFFTL